MTTLEQNKLSTLPFVAALGEELAKADPLIAAHFSLAPGCSHYRGVMQQVWRIGGWRGIVVKPFLKWFSQRDMLFSQTGKGVRFELINEVSILADGRVQMTWERLFHFPGGTERFFAVMVYDAKNKVIVDYLGKKGQLGVELHCQVGDGAMCITSGQQWWQLGKWRLPWPKLLAGQAAVTEWQVGEEYCIEVVIRNPLVGKFFGYAGQFEQVLF